MFDTTHGEFNLDKVNDINKRYIRASALSIRAKNKSIITGNFNMPDNDDIYQQNFATFNNVINKGIA